MILSLLLLLVSSLIGVNYSQNPQELCNSGRLASFLCRAGQKVLGGAAKLASRLLNRPKHWGVPANEPLELSDDYNYNLANPPVINEYYDFSNHRRSQWTEAGDQQGRPEAGQRGQARVPWPFRKRKRIRCRAAENDDGVCRPLHSCYHKHGSSIKYLIDGTQCPQDSAQVCCPVQVSSGPRETDDSGQQQQFDPNQLGNFKFLNVLRPLVPLDKLRSYVSQVFREPNREEQRWKELERNAVDEGITLKKHSPSDLHQRFIQLRNSKEVAQLAKTGSDFLEVASRVAKDQVNTEAADSKCGPVVESSNDGSTLVTTDRETKPGDQCYRNVSDRALQEIDFSQTELRSRCPNDPVCNQQVVRSRYRTIDGSCNNLQRTSWGKANTPYSRILFPDYEDGFNTMRATGVTGRRLPNPRSVSLATVIWSERADNRASIMLMQWGQFLDHDLTLAATTPMLTPQGTNIDCCNRRLLTDSRFKHPACISILLPDQDPFYSRYRIGCMNLVRNAPSPPVGCRLRHRDQLNQLTHFIDGSMIYGNDEQQAADLRLGRGGLLKSSRVNGAEFLPFDGRVGEGCVLPTEGIRRGMRCFMTGDQRVNELTGLVTIHTMFMREHNRIARILWSLNPSWPDEIIYQETRRIVIAQIQHITYNEFLPLIVGPGVMRDFRLKLSQVNKGFSYDYDPMIDPSVINEFAGAAYRLHSLVQGSFKLQTEDGQVIQEFKLRNIFNNPASLYREGNYDGCIHALLNQPSQSLDQHFTEDLTNHLFQDFNASFGMDLVSVNIQRGRDHGIPGYNFFRKACGLVKIRSFQELDRVMVPGAGRLFSQLYAHVDDIDLFIAGSYEKKLREAMVGPVFGCIIGEQFRRSRAGDRYWYENGNQAGAFSPIQLAEIKRGSSMARIICDNSDNIERVQPLAFLRATDWNPKVACEQLPWIDLRVWQQNFVDSGQEYDGVRAADNDIDDGLD